MARELPYQTAIKYGGFGNISWGEKLRRAYQVMTGKNDYRGSASQNTLAQAAMMNGTLNQKIRTPQAAAPAPAPAPAPATDLINKMGDYLKNQKSPTEVLPYETYADPQRKVFNEFERTTMRPEHEFYTETPFLQNAANSAAVNDAGMSGKATSVFNMGFGNMNRAYQDKVDAAKKMYEDMISEGYQRKLKEIGASPTQTTNIGTLDPSLAFATLK